MEECGYSEVDVCVGREVNVFPLGGVEGVVYSESGLQVVMKEVIRGEKRPSMAKWGVDSPKTSVDLPVEMFEKVDDGLKGVVGSRLGFGKLIE